MNAEKKPEKDLSRSWPFALVDVPESMRSQAEIWFNDQAELLESLQNAMAAWMKRRQEGTEAALRAVEGICSCSDPSQAMAVYNEWLAGSAGRIAIDLAALRDEALHMMRIGQRNLGAFAAASPLAAAVQFGETAARAGGESAQPRFRRAAS